MKRVKSFTLTGQIQAIEPPKYLEITHQGSRVRIKLAKFLRPSLVTMQVGQWIRVVGQQEIKPEAREEKARYKASDLMILEGVDVAQSPVSQPVPVKPQVITICTKGSCRKLGSLTLLADLSQQCPDGIAIVPSGCLKNCQAGPTACVGSQGLISRATPERVWGQVCASAQA